MNIPELKNCALHLTQEPLARIMLGQRELFHSNMLAWIFDKFPTKADNLFMDITGFKDAIDSPRKLLREKERIDLWIEWNTRKPLIIENKTFSLPKEEQLEGYGKKLSQKYPEASYYLLSLLDPGWIGGSRILGGVKWQFISYETLGNALTKTFTNSEQSYDNQIAYRYSKMINTLTQLEKAIRPTLESNSAFLDQNVTDIFEKVKLKSSLHKMRAAQVARIINTKLKEDGFGDRIVKADLTRTKPLLECFIQLKSAQKDISWGWQFQEGQLRAALKIPEHSGKTKEKKEKRIEVAYKLEHLFDFEFTKELTINQPEITMPKNGAFCHFSPEFIYRYKKCKSLSVMELVEITKVFFKLHEN